MPVELLEKIEGFEWDHANIEHILRHQVTPLEVGEAVGRANVTIPANMIGGENRWKLFGKTNSHRYLVVCSQFVESYSARSPPTS